jgi:hypothetical protein
MGCDRADDFWPPGVGANASALAPAAKELMQTPRFRSLARKLGLSFNLVEVDSSMGYTVRKSCTKVERSDDGLRVDVDVWPALTGDRMLGRG